MLAVYIWDSIPSNAALESYDIIRCRTKISPVPQDKPISLSEKELARPIGDDAPAPDSHGSLHHQGESRDITFKRQGTNVCVVLGAYHSPTLSIPDFV